MAQCKRYFGAQSAGKIEGEAALHEAASPELRLPDVPRLPDLPDILDAPSQDHKDRMTTTQLMSRWAEQSRFMLVMDFIAEQKLHGALNVFLKKRVR